MTPSSFFWPSPLPLASPPGVAPGVGPTQFGDNKYTYREFSATPEKYNQYLIKTDHQLTPKHRLTLSYFLYDYSVKSNPGGLTTKWEHARQAAPAESARQTLG